MELEKYDVVIRNININKNVEPRYELTIIGRDDVGPWQAETIQGVVQKMNWTMYSNKYDYEQRLEKNKMRLTKQIRKDSGVKPWQFWRRANPALHAEMKQIVDDICNNTSTDLTFEEITDEALKRWDQHHRG